MSDLSDYRRDDGPELGMAAGLDYLRRLGLDIPLRPTDEQVDRAHQRLLGLIGERAIPDLARTPMIVNRVWRGALDVLANLVPLARVTDVNLLDVILLHTACLSLERGFCDASAYAFVRLSATLRVRYQDYKRGYEFGQLAVTVVDRCGHSRFKASIYLRFGGLVMPWTRRWSDGLPYIAEAATASAETGDAAVKASSARRLTNLLLLAGSPLDDVGKEAERGYALAGAPHAARHAASLGAQLALVRALRGTAAQREPHGRALAPDADPANARAAFTHACCQLTCRFIFRDIEGALAARQAARQSLRGSEGSLEVVDYHFYGALAHAAAYVAATRSEERAPHWEAIEAHRVPLSILAEACPVNFAGRYALVAARVAELGGNVLQAERLYSEAIEHAQKHGYRQLYAIANEQAAELYASRGLMPVARSHLRNARSAYTVWGAEAKVRNLNEQFRQLLESEAGLAPARPAAFPLQQLDIAAVMRSTHALASEIVLDRLIEALVTTALEHAGARRCVLVTLAQTGLLFAAQARLQGEQIDVRIDKPPLSLSDVPVPVVQAVIRTSRPLVLDNAAETGPFTDDEYVRRHQSRSIACTPLVNQGNLVAVLYLENDLAAGAFTEGKAAMLTVLGSQAAIALENARIYHDLIDENRRRAEAEEALRNALANLARVARLTTMGELVASIVHEVTQPITAINTSCMAAMRWMNREPESPNMIEAKNMIRNVIEDCARAGQVIHGLRAMAKKSEPEFVVFDLDQAISEVLALLRGQLNDNGATLDAQLAGDRPVRGDRVQIQQVMLNLVLNAMEAMGTVSGRSRLLTVSTETVDIGTVRVSVADNGPGLPASVADRVFDPFITTKQSGMGMGLSICRSIIESHGGKLSFSAREPFGMVFRFTLPTSA